MACIGESGCKNVRGYAILAKVHKGHTQLCKISKIRPYLRLFSFHPSESTFILKIEENDWAHYRLDCCKEGIR